MSHACTIIMGGIEIKIDHDHDMSFVCGNIEIIFEKRLTQPYLYEKKYINTGTKN